MSTTNTIYPAARICADYIAEALSTTTKRPLFVGFQGPQGSGKTTLTNQTKSALLALPTPINATVFSIDDLYLPYEGLTALARSHPENALLQGRGQPGTHDPKLGGEILERLSRGEEVSVPIFDKSRYGGYGDRSNESVVVRLPVDVVILEGWCFGFRPLAEAELKERYEATRNESRAPYFKSHSIKSLTDVNDNLRSYAELWYPYFTHFIQIVPENLYDVFEWRLQQEHAMKLKNGGQGMSDDEVHNFVARYMPGYELFQHTIEDQSNPWVGHGIKIVLDKQRIVVKTGSF